MRLERIEADRESTVVTLAQQKRWIWQGTSWRDKVTSIPEFAEVQRSNQSAAKRVNDAIKQTRHLLIDFAVRAYQLETGKRPKSFADLVPAYLKAIPTDPETGGALNYSFE